MRIFVAILVSLTVLAAIAPPVSAHSETGSYTLSSTPFVSVVCSPNCLGVPGANLGGYQFGAGPEVPASVVIEDVSGGAVPYTVCQDLNADSLCGNTDPTVGPIEPNAEGCGTSVTLTGFRSGFVTSIFVRAVDSACTGATSGVITLTYAS